VQEAVAGDAVWAVHSNRVFVSEERQFSMLPHRALFRAARTAAMAFDRNRRPGRHLWRSARLSFAIASEDAGGGRMQAMPAKAQRAHRKNRRGSVFICH